MARTRLELRNCSIVDSQDERTRPNAVVQVVEDRIAYAGPAAQAPVLDGARVIDLEGGYLLPGLMDCHAHLFFLDPLIPRPQNVAAHTAYCATQAVNALKGGFTALRCVAEGWGVDVALRNLFNSGAILGPRLWVSGEGLTPSGGHVAEREDFWGIRVCDGVDGWRKAARDQLQIGADHLKVIATGGAIGHDQDVTNAVTIVEEELQAAAQVFHSRNRPVVVHATAPEGIMMGLRAKARTIEHGYELDEPTMKALIDTGTFLTPTLSITHQVPSQHDDDYMRQTFLGYKRADWKVKRAEERLEGHQANFIKALKAGVKMIAGSDFAPFPGASHCELAFMARAGMSPWQVIVCATRNAAEAVGALANMGTIEAGKWADLIVVEHDPLQDVRALRHPKLVLKGGQAAVNAFTD